MGWLSRLLGGAQVAGANGAQAPWQTPPIAPPQQNQPQQFRVDAPVMQPIGQAPPQGQLRVDAPTIQPMGQPAPAAPQRGGAGLLGRFLGGAQPQQSTASGAPQAPTIRSNPLTFALGGQNALNSMFQNQLAQQQQVLANQAEQRNQQAFGMQQTQFGWQNEERQQEREQRERYEEWARGQTDNPLATINPEVAFQTEAEARAAARQPLTPYQRETLELQRRGLDIDAIRANNSRTAPLSPAQERLYRNDYEDAQQDFATQVGPQVMAAMSWATQIGPNGEPPQGAPTADVLVNDQGLLRAVARLQTGVGVLTEGEVRDTVGNNLANQLQEQGASFNLNTRLRPEVRGALARLVQDGSRRVASRAWSGRDNALAAYEAATGRTPAGWSLPQFVHPDDMGSLNAAERIAGSQGAPALRPNDVRIAPSGREYRYVGRGNWLPIGEGNTAGYQAGREQRQTRARQAPERPRGVPPEAVWNAERQRWVAP